MKKRLAALLIALLPPFIPSISTAAVFITTGTDSSGHAYIALPPISFTITTTASTSLLAIVFEDVLPPSTSTSYGASGNGVGLVSSSHSFAADFWSSGPVSTDAALFLTTGSASSPVTFTVGQIYAIPETTRTFTTTATVPVGFPVFPSGSYNVFLQSASGAGQVLSGYGVVPEPSVVGLLLISVGAIAGFRWRRQRHPKVSLS